MGGPSAAMDSAPKRVTRGTAARAKTAPTATSTSTMTSGFMAGTRSTAAKRKTRADEKDDEDLAQREAAAKRPRGGGTVVAKADTTKPKPAPAMKTTTTTAAAAGSTGVKATRGRPRKVVTTAAAAAAAGAEPTGRVSRSSSSATLTRAKTTATTATTTTTSVTRATTKTTTVASNPPVKKAVKFREPDKENAGVGEKKPAGTGLRGRPARRGGAAALARAGTRATGKAATASSSSATSTSTSKTGPIEKKPLSALKMTQKFATWEESDDELAREKTPVKPLMKSPIKPPTAKKTAPAAAEHETKTETETETETEGGNAASAVIFSPLDINAVSLGSPIRPPHSPAGDGLKSPAKRIQIQALGSALKPIFAAAAAADQHESSHQSQSPLKPHLLQSAAKRPVSPIKGLKPHSLATSSQDLEASVSGTASKLSMFQSPAKRAMPGFRSIAESLSASVSTRRAFPALKLEALSAKPSEKLLHEIDMVGEGEGEGDDVFTGPMESLRLTGRVGRVLFQGVSVGGEKMEKKNNDAVNEEEVEEVEEEEVLKEIEVPVVLELTPEEVQHPFEASPPRHSSPEPFSPKALSPRALSLQQSSPKALSPKNLSPEVSSPEEQSPKESPKVLSPEVLSSKRSSPNGLSPELSPEAPTDKQANPLFELREKDQDSCHDMSPMSSLGDDEGKTTHPQLHAVCETPVTNAKTNPMFRGIASSVSKSGRRTTLGFSSLADQLGAWSAASPVKAQRTARKIRFASVAVAVADEDANAEASADIENDQAVLQPAESPDSPMSDDSPEDGIPASTTPTVTPRPLIQETEETEETEEKDWPVIFNDISFTEEDKALVQEANDMCASDVHARQPFNDGLSDASQEYADENQVPALPAVEHEAQDKAQDEAQDELPPLPVTPVRRPVTRTFHTTAKVPLKPSDDSSPSPLKKRSYSASRAAPKRPSSLSKVTMATPNVAPERRRSPRKQPTTNTIPEETAPTPSAPATPAKTSDEAWLAVETPGRTPRKDLNPNLLRGAIVFVDVHTSEGADASGIFIELLTQMGARCVKSWNWTPAGSEGSASSKKVKVGITHVVFKDGSKRTLEKVREAHGVVQCVGVSWVLNCERANEWVDEALYCIDTSTIPRGGARRRRSMEPKALRESLGASPCTPRRQSTIWMQSFTTGDDYEGGGAGDDIEGSSTFLTPVPKTPAPEAIARFAAETPSDAYDDDDDDEEGGDSLSPLKGEMLMRTCPAKSRFRDADAEAGGGGAGGILGGLHQSLTQDEDVRVRLMAARRKSLQFAPKVGSPLAKMWR